MTTASVWAPGESVNSNSTVRVESFVASAGQTLFNLTTFTYTLGTSSLFVYRSGILQRPGIDFVEVAPNQFKFTTAIDTANTVVVALGFPEISYEYNTAILRGDLAGSNGARYIGFMLSVAGAAFRDVYNKLSDLKSVKDFEVVLDGVNDDTAELQAAINSVAPAIGVKLLIPDGTLKLSDNIRLRRNTILWGSGRTTTTILQTADKSGFVMNETTDSALVYGIMLQDFTLAKQTKTSTVDVNGVWLTGTAQNVWDCLIQRVNVSGFYDGIRIDRPILTRIDSGHVSDNYHNGIVIGSGGTSLKITNTFSRANGLHGYYVEGGLYYCNFDTTASDNNGGCGYYFKDLAGARPTSFTLNACGCESNGGDGFKLEKVESFVLNGCFSFRNTGHGFNILSNCKDIQLNGSKAVNNTGYGINTDSTNASVVVRGASFTATGYAANVAGDYNTNSTDLAILDSNGFITGQDYWVKIPFTYANFANTFTTGDFVTSTALPTNAVVTDCYVKLTTAFSGGTVASATMQVGGPTSPGSSPYNQYMSAQNVFTGASGIITGAAAVKVVSAAANGKVIARLICTGGNTNTLTAGAGFIMVKFHVLPL